MKSILLLILICVSSTLTAQTTITEIKTAIEENSEKELVRKNFELLNSGDFYFARIVSEKLLSYQSDNPNYNYRHGFALLYSSDDFSKALPFLEIGASSISKNYNAFSTREKDSPIDALYHYGNCLHLNLQLNDAKSNLNRFLEEAESNNTLVPFAQTKLKQIKNAEYNIKNTKNYKLENLSNQINTEAADYSAMVSLDGSALYFTSRRLREDSSNYSSELRQEKTFEYLEDIYVSYIDAEGTWSKPSILDFCEVNSNEATAAISSSERKIFVYKDTEGNGDIFHSDFTDGGFKKIEHFDNTGINSLSWEPHLTVTTDGLEMYFSSDRPGGFGGRDIYRIIKLPNGEWSLPSNLGPTINTSADEDSPFIAVDNKTLYFASNGDKSMGGFDIFISVKNDNNWSSPINLGYPLNSTGDDLYYTTTMDGRTGYLTSFRKDGIGEKDIYEIKNDYLGIKDVTVLKGNISALDGDLPEDVTIVSKCINCNDKSGKVILPRARDGVFFSALELNSEYDISYFYDNGNKQFHNERIFTGNESEFKEIKSSIIVDTKTMKVVDSNGVEINNNSNSLSDNNNSNENGNNISNEGDNNNGLTNSLTDNNDANGNSNTIGDNGSNDSQNNLSDGTPDDSYCSISYKHNFDYNNVKNTTEELKVFLTKIDQQFNDGRVAMNLTIVSSASTVHTSSFKNNQELADYRANEMKQTILNFIEGKEYRDKINISIKSSGVNGPKYKRGTKDRKDLYSPYQYVSVTSEGYNCDIEIEPILSSDEFNTSNTSTKNSIGSEAGNGNNLNLKARYNISTGAFRNIMNAESMIEVLKEKGYSEAEIVGKEKNLWVVVAYSSNSLTETRSTLQELKQNVETSSYIIIKR
ncbi:MAG: hypothetical protein ACPGU5_01385 [Lishizhenia sp.]